MSMCEACERGDHANCGMQSWCDCEDERDGDHESIPDWSEDDLPLGSEPRDITGCDV